MKTQKRNGSIEVLRCFLMLVIVIHHGCNNGPFLVDGANHDVKFGAWLLFWATNAFVFISGWFGIRFSWMRVTKFLGLGAYAALVLFILSPLALGHYYFQFSLGWFGNSYLALMLIAPLVNAGLDALENKSHRLCINAWLCYAAAVFLSWLPMKQLGFSLAVPGWWGHSFNTMLFVYVSAYVLRRSNWFLSMGRMTAALFFVGALLLHIGQLCIVVFCKNGKIWMSDATDYDSLPVLVMGTMAFLFFLKINFPTWLQKVAIFLSPSMFMVYLLHTKACNPTGVYLVNKFLFSFDQYIANIPAHRVVAVVIGGFIVFVMCICIDFLRRGCVVVVQRVIKCEN